MSHGGFQGGRPPRPAGLAVAERPLRGGGERYRVLRAVLSGELDAERVTAALKDAGLRGMGGAGFPTGRKWELVAAQAAQPKYAICNADESEPGTFKDRQILAEQPHLVLEGLLLVAALRLGPGIGRKGERQRGNPFWPTRLNLLWCLLLAVHEPERWCVSGGDTAHRLDAWSEILASDPSRLRGASNSPDARGLPRRRHPPADRRSDAGRLRGLPVPRSSRSRGDDARENPGGRPRLPVRLQGDRDGA